MYETCSQSYQQSRVGFDPVGVLSIFADLLKLTIFVRSPIISTINTKNALEIKRTFKQRDTELDGLTDYEFVARYRLDKETIRRKAVCTRFFYRAVIVLHSGIGLTFKKLIDRKLD